MNVSLPAIGFYRIIWSVVEWQFSQKVDYFFCGSKNLFGRSRRSDASWESKLIGTPSQQMYHFLMSTTCVNHLFKRKLNNLNDFTLPFFAFTFKTRTKYFKQMGNLFVHNALIYKNVHLTQQWSRPARFSSPATTAKLTAIFEVIRGKFK